MLWDLRNVRAPERILSGHQKGVLSVSWCGQDSDLLLSCGKDNRTLVWNPQTGEIVGELPPSNDWAFQTSWSPRNPDLLATASFDGHIGIHSLQTTSLPQETAPPIAENVTDDDVFGALGAQEEPDQTANVLSLQQTPKWLRRPVSATFGFGGLLASTSNLPGASGKHQSGVVHLRQVVTEQSIIDRANALQETAGDKGKMATFCEGRTGDAKDTAWKTLQTLFKADSREDLFALLGFSKADVARQVQEAIKKLPAPKAAEGADSSAEDPAPSGEDGIKGDVTPPARPSLDGQATPSELSGTSGSTKETGSTAATDLGLFDEDSAPGTPGASAADFFSSMAAGTHLRNPALDSIVPHKSEVAESSVAATIGSRASSIRSEAIKDNTFRIYPSGESETDKLITHALVLGDFASAVELCLASERYADALLLAVRGGPDLLQSTQKAYFARRTTVLPFLRVFQSIVTEDLVDIVQNADLEEWKVAFVVVCTFAKDGDFANLADQLGQRLQYKWLSTTGSDAASARRAREDATLCYLAARKLEKVVSIWADEMREEEESSTQTKYTAHAQALQSFIEKVTVFATATGYVDEDLLTPTQNAEAADAGARTYKLAPLYDRYYEYADLLATQGLVDLAAKYVQMTPTDYKGTGAAGSELDKARDRLLRAAGQATGSSIGVQALGLGGGSRAAQSQPAAVGGRTTGYAPVSAGGYAPRQPAAAAAPSFGGQGYQPAAQPQPQPVISQSQPTQPYGAQYGGYNSGASNPYAPAQPAPSTSSNAYAPNQAYGAPSTSPYAPAAGANGYGMPSDPQPQGYGLGPASAGPYGVQQPGQAPLGPPRMGSLSASASNNSTPPPLPAAQRRDIPGWNDAPSFAAPPKRPQSAAKENRPAPIMSPFPVDPNAPAVPAYGAPPQGPPQGFPPPAGQGQGQYGQPQQGQGLPPPPAGPPRFSSTGQPSMFAPPPKGGARPPSAQKVAQAASGGLPAGPPPPQQQQLQRPPPPSAQSMGPGGPAPQGQAPRAGPPPTQFQGQPGLQARPPPPPGVMAGPPPPRAMSPLNPAAQAGRAGSPFSQGLSQSQLGVRPPAAGAQRALSPPQQYSPPAASGGFGQGGPAPPGRSGSVGSAGAAGAPSAPSAPVPQQSAPKPQEPAKPKYRALFAG